MKKKSELTDELRPEYDMRSLLKDGVWGKYSRSTQALTSPDLKEVKAFANHLHSLGKHWQGEIFGWQAGYTPESDKKPEDSKMTSTPADFWIGENAIWFFSLMWERGKDKDPTEFIGDRGIVK